MSSRRAFLAASAAIATLPATPGVVHAAALPTIYDFPAIDARLARQAKHRQIMAVNRVADGVVLGYMGHSMDAYENAMGEGPGAMHVGAVLYGRGVILGLNDTMWKTYRLAEAARRRGDVLTTQGSDVHPFASEFSGLVKRGAFFLICDNALTDWATYLVTTAGFNDRTIEAVHADLRAHLVSGGMLVPAGVAALNTAQEARFTYFQASL
jgi:hypothetical protein